MYTIEKRKISGYGTIETVYEVRTYEKIADNGCFIGGKTIKTVKEKKNAESYLRKKGLRFIGKRDKSTDVWMKNSLFEPQNIESEDFEPITHFFKD